MANVLSRRREILAIGLTLVLAPVHASPQCKDITGAAERLACYDQQAGETKVDKFPITVVKTRFVLADRDILHDVMNDQVELHFTFKNSGTKEAVAIKFHTHVEDAFGEVLVDENGQMDLRLLPGQQREAPSFYKWERSSIGLRRPYDQLIGPVTEKTTKVTVQPVLVVFADGSKQPLLP